MRFSYRYAGSDRSVQLEFRYQALRDNIAAGRVTAHRQAVKRVRRALSYTIRRDEIGAGRVWSRAAVVGGPIVGLGALLAALVLVRRRRSRAVLSEGLGAEP